MLISTPSFRLIRPEFQAFMESEQRTLALVTDVVNTPESSELPITPLATRYPPQNRRDKRELWGDTPGLHTYHRSPRSWMGPGVRARLRGDTSEGGRRLMVCEPQFCGNKRGLTHRRMNISDISATTP